MNGHPRARIELILRQSEAPVKIYNSRWFPASNYTVKCSIMAGQWSNMKKMSNFFFVDFFLDFYIDPGGPGGHPGGSRTHPRAEKCSNMQFFKNCFFFSFDFYLRSGGPGAPKTRRVGGGAAVFGPKCWYVNM